MYSAPRILRLAALALCVCASTASARIGLYARADLTGSQLKMSEGNALLDQTERDFAAAGIRADLQHVKPAMGSSFGAGLWLTSWFRAGVTYSEQRSNNINHVHVPGVVFYAEDLDFRTYEPGAEAALRFDRFAGLTVGGHVARSRAKLIEGYTVQDFSGNLFQDGLAEKTMLTYGAYLGLEQTNEHGVTGFLRLGYQFRDFGSMPSQLLISDGFTSVQVNSSTISLDYSGWYLKLGCGFDLGR